MLRGALIRGLDELSPTLATIRVPSRVARKHIGTHVLNDFVEGKHDLQRRHASQIGECEQY